MENKKSLVVQHLESMIYIVPMIKIEGKNYITSGPIYSKKIIFRSKYISYLMYLKSKLFLINKTRESIIF